MKKYLSNLKYFTYIFWLPFWYLQRLIPRDKNTWIFGAWFGERYADNTRALYEYLLKEKPEIKTIWITRNKNLISYLNKKGINTYYYLSLKGIYYSSIAKYCFVCVGKKDVNSWFINGATTIQLWHGIPMKKINYDDKYANHSKFKDFVIKNIYPWLYEFNYSYYLSTSVFFDKIISRSFLAKESQIIKAGYPRNDVYFTNKKSNYIDNIRYNYPDSKIIAYLPTHRGDWIKNIDYFDKYGFDKDRIFDFLELNNLVLIFKGHFYFNNNIQKNKNSRFIQISNDDINDDVNLFLKEIDILITDYSGAYFDFLLTGKPLLLAPFDLNEYISSNRELYLPYPEYSCGYIDKNWNELLIDLSKTLEDDEFKSLREKKRLYFHEFTDNKNCQRIFEFIQSV